MRLSCWDIGISEDLSGEIQERRARSGNTRDRLIGSAGEDGREVADLGPGGSGLNQVKKQAALLGHELGSGTSKCEGR